MIHAKRKRGFGYWVMRGDTVIGEAWKFPTKSGFGMSIGGHFTDFPFVAWRNGRPYAWGYMAISAPRLCDLMAIAEKHFGEENLCRIA